MYQRDVCDVLLSEMSPERCADLWPVRTYLVRSSQYRRKYLSVSEQMRWRVLRSMSKEEFESTVLAEDERRFCEELDLEKNDASMINFAVAYQQNLMQCGYWIYTGSRLAGSILMAGRIALAATVQRIIAQKVDQDAGPTVINLDDYRQNMKEQSEDANDQD